MVWLWQLFLATAFERSVDSLWWPEQLRQEVFSRRNGFTQQQAINEMSNLNPDSLELTRNEVIELADRRWFA